MFIRKSQSKEFEKWIENLLINESLRNKISDWILKSPIEIGIRKFPSYSSSFISAGWMTDLFITVVFKRKQVLRSLSPLLENQILGLSIQLLHPPETSSLCHEVGL